MQRLGNQWTLMTVLVLVAAACGNTYAPLTDAGLPDAGDGGTCDIDLLASQLVGDSGIDCGSFQISFYWTGWDAGPLTAGVACALSAQDAGVPFTLRVWPTTVDSSSRKSLYVRTSSGVSFELSQTVNLGPPPNTHDGSVNQSSCSYFAATTFEGVPDLSCQSAGLSSYVCGPTGS